MRCSHWPICRPTNRPDKNRPDKKLSADTFIDKSALTIAPFLLACSRRPTVGRPFLSRPTNKSDRQSAWQKNFVGWHNKRRPTISWHEQALLKSCSSWYVGRHDEFLSADMSADNFLSGPDVDRQKSASVNNTLWLTAWRRGKRQLPPALYCSPLIYNITLRSNY